VLFVEHQHKQVLFCEFSLHVSVLIVWITSSTYASINWVRFTWARVLFQISRNLFYRTMRRTRAKLGLDCIGFPSIHLSFSQMKSTSRCRFTNNLWLVARTSRATHQLAVSLVLHNYAAENVQYFYHNLISEKQTIRIDNKPKWKMTFLLFYG